MIYDNRYTSCDITYESPTAATTSAGCTWVNYGTNAATSSRIKIKAYQSTGTSTSASYKIIEDINCGYPSSYKIIEDNYLSTGWRVGSAAITSCDIQLGRWGDECTVEYEWQGIPRPMSAEEKKAHEERQLKDRFSKIIQGRCAPNIAVRQNTKRQALPMPADIREQRARETLRRVIGDQKYINFIKHGFISVKGRSGLVYQIFTGHGITHVFNQGNLIERLCVVLQGSFPPTDSLIMRYLLILNNEQQFRSLAIKHSISGYERSRQDNGPATDKSLAEIFKELKSKVA